MPQDNYVQTNSGLYVSRETAADSANDNPWLTRIQSADRYFKEWENKFRCKTLEDYYEGFQWKGRRDYPTVNYNPYVINLVYSTIKIKLAGLLFQKPKYLLNPTPGSMEWNEEFAIRSAQLKEDVVNTIVRNPSTNFKKHVKLAAQDSFFRYGMMEVGYANDWRNPQKVTPELKSWTDSDVGEEEDKIVEDNPVPTNERIYVKRIRPNRFRVCVSESCDLNDHDWFGYYDFYYTRVLQNTKGINWPASYSGGTYINAEYGSGFIGNFSSNVEDTFKRLYNIGSLSKVWHIWDNVTKQRLMLLEDYRMSELWSGPFEHHGLIDLRWDLRSAGFYPIPPVFQWLSPQDEINEAREQTRSYRRRFTRKFQAIKGAIDEEEKEKFASGPDGIIIETKIPDGIKAIDNPEQGPTTENALLLAKDDFNIISGTSAEARGQTADRETATQSKIVQARSMIRESAEQLDFSSWLCLIGREILVTCQERMTEGLWVKFTSATGTEPEFVQSLAQDPQLQQFAQSMMAMIQQQAAGNGPVYRYITSQQIDDGYDYELEFDIQNATPAAMEAGQQSFVNWLALLQNPVVMMSPPMIREAAYRVGYRNEAIIKQAQQAALLQAQMQAQQIMNQGSGGPGGQGNNIQNQGKSRRAQMATPSGPEITNQLTSQLQ